MESTRQAKIARLLQKELSEILRLQTAKTHGIIISVSAVRVSPDLSIAKAYLSIFPSAKSQEILDNLTRNAKTIRYDLGQKVRFQLRKVPELAFYLDDSLDYIENIDNLLKEEGEQIAAAEARNAADPTEATDPAKG
ncbi:MAG: 30S ribosome-binding factor RbfA [Muribaculaceae bacterium]|nr:30S ribosome-binding factor RbfA [Muribaculaceae bacterium]